MEGRSNARSPHKRRPAAILAPETIIGRVIAPFVEGDQLDIHPLLVFVSVLVGATLRGPAGAFVAVPLAAILDLLVKDVVMPWRKAQFHHDIELRSPAGDGD